MKIKLCKKSKLFSCLLVVMLCMINVIPAFAMAEVHDHNDITPYAPTYCPAGGNHEARATESGILNFVYNNKPQWRAASLYTCFKCGAGVISTGYPAAAYPYLDYYTFNYRTNCVNGACSWDAITINYSSSGKLTGWTFFE
ncbi:hypothetical protein [Clostridium culturomicium]|uniref:hypothetical protein n=1 Tax=Clostridium culturomicium TaxID=1499683 RepID=UPI0038576F3A